MATKAIQLVPLAIETNRDRPIRQNGAVEATITVERNAARDIRMRDLYVQLDDLPEDSLEFGESIAYPAQPGRHRIRVTNRVKKEVIDFELQMGESARFSAANVATKGLVSILMSITGTVPYRSTIKRIDRN